MCIGTTDRKALAAAMTNWLGGQILLFFVYCVVFGSTVSSQCHVCEQDDYRLPAFDGKSVSDFPLTTQKGLGELWMCTRMCGQDSKCKSYRYNCMTGVCSTYAVGYSTPENTFNAVSKETGSSLYQMCGVPQATRAFGTACKSTTDCDFSYASCTDGSCRCSVGYSYDPNTGGCVTNCASYGDFFAKFPKHDVSGCNTREVNTPTGDACFQACRDETSFVCINVEYKVASGDCNMCDQAWFDLPPMSGRDNIDAWDVYHRHCAL